MAGMHTALRAVFPALAALVAAGCAARSEPVPAAVPAPPQQVELGWVERTPPDAPGLVFEVRRFAVTADGWRADVGIRNTSGVPWRLAATGTRMFGLMLFATGGLDELERRNGDGDLPGLRSAREIVPALPPVLEPGTHWSGTISAPGRLAAGRWMRLVFGTLGNDDPPPGLPTRLVWITDRALVLRR
jgi:hypothetical protein